MGFTLKQLIYLRYSLSEPPGDLPVFFMVKMLVLSISGKMDSNRKCRVG